jgi:hypothetical protein
MNAWEIGLQYVQTLAWPAVVIFFGLRFKAQAGRLLDRLTSLKTPAGSAEFDRQAREVATEAQAAEAKEIGEAVDRSAVPQEEKPSTGSGAACGEQSNDATDAPQTHNGVPAQPVLPAELLRAWTSDEFGPFREIAAIDPAAAVLGAWRRVEQFMHVALRTHEKNQPQTHYLALNRQLNEIGLGPHFVRVAKELRRLRNSVTHGQSEITPAGALDYIDAAERLADALVMLQRRQPD